MEQQVSNEADNVIGWGVIGAGGIARRRTIPGLLNAKGCALKAVMDVAHLDEIAAEFGVKGYDTEVEILRDPEINVVYIASPVHVHLKQIEMAAAAGKHILCEKPLTLTTREAELAVQTCEEYGVLLQEGYMMKFHGAHQIMKELIDAGRLGKLVYIRAQLACWYPPIADAWRQDPSRGGGGALKDLAVHLYDLLSYLVGPIQSIYTATGNLVHDYASEDSATTLLTFASGAMATVDTFFCVPDEASKTRLEIYGSQGSLLSEGTVGQSVGGKLEGVLGSGQGGYDATQSKDGVRAFEAIAFPQIDPYQAECEYFANCVRQGHTPTISGPDNALQMARLVDAAYASSRQRVPVKVEG